MRLDSISIRNFRLLRRVSLDLTADLPTTVLVGPNNSGKTSVMDALRLFAGPEADTRRISLHDLSQSELKMFKGIEKRIAAAEGAEAKTDILRRFAPRMRMDLKAAGLLSAQKFSSTSQLRRTKDYKSNSIFG